MGAKRGMLLALFAIGVACSIGPATDWTQTAEYGPYPSLNANIASLPVEAETQYQQDFEIEHTTQKWAGVFGTFTSGISILLGNSEGASVFHQWSWAPSNGGVVCLSLNSNYPWGLAGLTNNSTVDYAWGFDPLDSDSSSNTLAADCNGFEVAGLDLTGTAALTPNMPGADASAQTCVIKRTGAIKIKPTQFAFCSEIKPGMDLLGGTDNADFQLVVPTAATYDPTLTYYFYVDLH
ncbi:MAG: hypothetical protein QW035_01740 [Candidatus Anstonellales archaeon]